MTTPEAAQKLVTVRFANRDVNFNMPTPDQYLVLNRLIRALGRSTDDDSDRQDRTIVKLLDSLSYLMEDDDTRDFVDDLIISGRLGIVEFLETFSTGLSSAQEKLEQDQETSTEVPRKVSKKVAAKKVARARRVN